MNTRDVRIGRWVILLSVLASHGALLSLAVRAHPEQRGASNKLELALDVFLLPPPVRLSGKRWALGGDAIRFGRLAPGLPVHAPEFIEITPPIVTPNDAAVPPVDWRAEAGLVARRATEDQPAYRDLSALTPAQLTWVRQNKLEPAQPGIAWSYRRIEITEGGFPIIHINDHCVAIPLMMFMVFCAIGTIEPKGDLFEHMRDPRSP